MARADGSFDSMRSPHPVYTQLTAPKTPFQPALERSPSGTDHRLIRIIGFIVTDLTGWSRKVVRLCNDRATAEHRFKEGKDVVKWTRLCCHNFKDHQVRIGRSG